MGPRPIYWGRLVSPGELLWDLATILTIGALARGLTRARADAARWQHLATLNVRARLAPPEDPDELKYGPVIPAELLDKLPTLRPGDMARHRYSPGGHLPTPPNPTDKETDHE